MPLQAPVSSHLDLYRYWLTKRGARSMPARDDIDPADIPALVPYLTIVDKVDGRLRYRLVGTAAAKQRGCDLTGRLVGSYPEDATELPSAYENVFATGRPLFVTGEYKSMWGNICKMSQLVLPLSDDGANVNMVFFVRIARFNVEARGESGHLEGVPLRMCDAVSVAGAEDIERLCIDWERRSP